MTRNQTRTSNWVTASEGRGGASSGTRISGGYFRPSAPKGGFVQPIYDTGKAVARYFGYNPEKYVRDRLVGTRREDFEWRTKHLRGRKLANWRAQALFPSYGKKKFPSGKVIQKSARYYPGKLLVRYNKFGGRNRSRRYKPYTDVKYRRKRAYRKYYQVYRTTSRSS